jgi:hypothetical protein
MRRIETVEEWSYWNSLARDSVDDPFELAIVRNFPVLVGAGYSSMFHSETIKAVRAWSWRHGGLTVAMFFTAPDPKEYQEESGVYGGILVDGGDDPADIEDALFSTGVNGSALSIYDVSHRFAVVPEDGSWMMMGDRDADIALYGFVNEASRKDFMHEASDLVVFGSLEDAARYAKNFMSYELVLP